MRVLGTIYILFKLYKHLEAPQIFSVKENIFGTVHLIG